MSRACVVTHDNDERWRRAHQAAEAAGKRALSALKTACPVGRVVRWEHGTLWRWGTVIEIVGFSYHNARVQVRSSASGRRFAIDAQRVLGALAR